MSLSITAGIASAPILLVQVAVDQPGGVPPVPVHDASFRSNPPVLGVVPPVRFFGTSARANGSSMPLPAVARTVPAVLGRWPGALRSLRGSGGAFPNILYQAGGPPSGPSAADDPAAPGSPASGDRPTGVTRFVDGLTIETFTSSMTDCTLYLGFAENGVFEAHDASQTETRPSDCQIRLQVDRAGDRHFEMWFESPLAAGEWVSLDPTRWRLGLTESLAQRNALASLRSITRSVIVGASSPRIVDGLDSDYAARVVRIYDIFRAFRSREGRKLSFFHEIMRLQYTSRTGAIFGLFYTEEGTHFEYVLCLAERIYATMGLDDFVMEINPHGHLTVRAGVEPGRLRSNSFRFQGVAPAVYSVTRWDPKTSTWVELGIEAYRDINAILGVLTRGAFETTLATAIRSDEDRDEADRLTRRQLGFLLTMDVRADEFQALFDRWRMVRDGDFDAYTNTLVRASLDFPFCMDFFTEFPCEDPAHPERRFLTAMDRLFQVISAPTIHMLAHDGSLGKYGRYYLRYALRVCVAQMIEKYRDEEISTLPGTNTEKLNNISDFLEGLVRSLMRDGTALQHLRDSLPLTQITELARSRANAAQFPDRARVTFESLIRRLFTQGGR